MKKLCAIVLVAVMLCSMLSLFASAADMPEWSDYIASVEVLDLDQIVIKGHTEKDGTFVCDEWKLPQNYRFTMKDGSKIDVTADYSGIQHAEDDAVFSVQVADGIELTFIQYITIMAKNDYILLGISQRIGEGEDARYIEVTTEDIDYDFGSSANNDKSALNLWDRIVLFIKELIRKIEIFFLQFSL